MRDFGYDIFKFEILLGNERNFDRKNLMLMIDGSCAAPSVCVCVCVSVH